MELELKEVGKSLNLPASTIERWIRQGRIPIKRRGDFCAFNKIVLRFYMEEIYDTQDYIK